jgi:hypothetical protein
MSDADRKLVTGEYLVECKNQICGGESANGRRKNPPKADGEVLSKGAASRLDKRVISSDGNEFTMPFYQVRR